MSPSNMPKTFVHKPLECATDKIRLIEFPAFGEKYHFSDRLECTMSTYTFTQTKLEPILYHALSYTWGDQDSNGFCIHINGSPFQISENLWHAIHDITRSSMRGLPIWVDALCIDQANTGERNDQVSIMNRIYAGATSVIAWLGPGMQCSMNLFEALKDPYQSEDDARLSYQGFSHVPQEAKVEFFKELYPSIQDLLFRPYWSRAWIRQELHFAREVNLVCGKYIFPAKRISDLLQRIPQGLSIQFAPNFTRLVHSAANEASWKVNFSLLALLETYGQGRCSLKHDRIYSLLPMANDAPQARGYPVNYDLPYEEVVVKTVAFLEFEEPARAYKLFSTLGDIGAVNDGFSERTIKLFAYAEHLRREHQDGMTWTEIMQIPHQEIRKRAPQIYPWSSNNPNRWRQG